MRLLRLFVDFFRRLLERRFKVAGISFLLCFMQRAIALALRVF
jgi:hypothetical protein